MTVIVQNKKKETRNKEMNTIKLPIITGELMEEHGKLANQSNTNQN